MKANISLLALALAGAINLAATAQDGPPAGGPPHPPGHEGGPRRGGGSPLVKALDVNHDGVIDASEIAGASAALLTLDANHDGKLSADELRPPHHGPEGTGPDGQQPPKPPGDDASGKRPHPPLVAALDVNNDGVIDAAEIANAPAALKTLDKNGDGQLTQDELRPAGGRGPGGPGGKGPGGRRGGPGGPKGPQGGSDAQ